MSNDAFNIPNQSRHSRQKSNVDMSDDSQLSVNSSIFSLSKGKNFLLFVKIIVANKVNEPWSEKVEHIRKMSSFSHLLGWSVNCLHF